MDTKKTVYLMVPGINWNPTGWDTLTQHWLNLNPTSVQGDYVDDVWWVDRCDYECGPISRAWHQQDRIDRFKSIASDYITRDYDMRIVAHSNGTDIALRGLAQMGWPGITALHLVSGACDASFQTNGLNHALTVSAIGRVFVYVAGKDWALRLASLGVSRLLGYGALGLHGPLHVDPDIPGLENKLDVTTEPDYSHSSWFDPGIRFKNTMGLIRRI